MGQNKGKQAKWGNYDLKKQKQKQKQKDYPTKKKTANTRVEPGPSAQKVG